MKSICSPLRKLRYALRVIGWNALFIIGGMTLIAMAGEAYSRLLYPRPFIANQHSPRFVPTVGRIRQPNAEIRHTNGLDFWTVSRTNSLGFVDREPPSLKRTAESCHIAMIGDSFVEAKEVPIADKFHVQLEELAARYLPGWDITTSAFGTGGTGQINQLPFYEEYARHLRPKLVVLVFVENDFRNNEAVLEASYMGWDPDRLPWTSAVRGVDGGIALRPPNPEYAAFRSPPPLEAVFGPILWAAVKRSDFANWVKSKIELSSPSTRRALGLMFQNEALPSVFMEDIEFTAFALDQFQERAAHDGVSLAILASHGMRSYGNRPFDRLNALAEVRSIPVIDQYDHILRHGGRIEDVRWTHDSHWNQTGHQWAAEALLEYLKQHPEICAAKP